MAHRLSRGIFKSDERASFSGRGAYEFGYTFSTSPVKFVESFCTAIGATTLIVFGFAVVTRSHYKFNPGALVLVVAVCVGYAAYRASSARRQVAESGRVPMRSALIGFLLFLACGVALITTSGDRTIRYSQTNLVFHHTAEGQAQLLDDFLSLHDYLTRNGFSPTSEPESPVRGLKGGLISDRMATFTFARQPDNTAGAFRIRVDLHPKIRRLTCYSESFGTHRSAFEEAIHRSEEFFQNLRQSELRFSKHKA